MVQVMFSKLVPVLSMVGVALLVPVVAHAQPVPVPAPPVTVTPPPVTVTPPPGMGAPVVTVSGFGTLSFTVSWPAIPGAVGYSVELGQGANGRRFNVFTNSFTAISPPGVVNVRVAALSANGLGPWSNWLRVVVPLPAPNPIALQASNEGLRASWSSPVEVGSPGGPTEFDVELKNVNSGAIRGAVVTTTNHLFTGLDGGVYTFRVRARNAIDVSPWMSGPANVTYAPPLSVPPGLTVASTKPVLSFRDGTVTVTWSRVTGASGYQVELAGFDWIMPRWIEADRSSSYTTTFNQLGPGTYRVRVAAVNANGFGPWSASKSVTVAEPTPVAPTGVRVTQPSWKSLNVSWDAVPFAARYEVRAAPTDRPGSVVTVRTTSPSARVSLSSTGPVVVTVKALNSAGDQSPSSAALRVIVPRIGPPTNVRTTPAPSLTGRGSKVTWSAPSGITELRPRYEVGITCGSGTRYTLVTLREARVRPLNDTGTGTCTVSVRYFPSSGAPGAPSAPVQARL